MSYEDLRNLKEQLADPHRSIVDKIKQQIRENLDIWNLDSYNRALVLKLYRRIKEFGKILTDPRFSGKLDLGIDPQKIAWEKMPPGLAACFKEQFEDRPEQITEFSIKVEDNYNDLALRMRLLRGPIFYEHVQAEVFAGVLVEQATGCLITDFNHNQPLKKQTSKAMNALKDSLGISPNEFTARASLLKSKNVLDFTDKLLHFAVAEATKQIVLKQRASRT